MQEAEDYEEIRCKGFWFATKRIFKEIHIEGFGKVYAMLLNNYCRDACLKINNLNLCCHFNIFLGIKHSFIL